MGKRNFNTLIIILLLSIFSTANLQSQDCLPPSYSSVGSITETSAVITWRDNNNHNSWNIVVSPTELADPSSAQVTGTVTGSQTMVSYTAHDLTPETIYYYYIQAHCDENNNSTWIGGNFTTRCADKPIPYINDFNAYESSTTSFPDCWTKVQGTAYTTYVDSEHENTLQMLNPSMVALPSFNLPIDTLRIQFTIMTSNANMSFEVGVIEALGSISTYTMIESIDLPSPYTYYEKSVNFSSYTGAGRYIVLRNTSTSSNTFIYIDDVTVSIIPDCLSPNNVVASDIMPTSATLTWEEMGTATQWQTLLSPTPISNFSGLTPATTSSNTFYANSLSPNSNYYFYVRSICSSDYSEWTEYSFYTPCSSSALPTSESFTFNQVPTCWSRTRVVGNADITFVGTGNNPYCNPIGGTAMVQWASSSNGSGWQARLASLPLNTTGAAALDVNFKWNHDLSNSNGLGDGVQIQYSTDGITWTNTTQGMIPRYDGIHSGWTEYDVIVPEAGNLPTVYIGFLFNTGGNGSNCFLDEVTFRTASGCFTPVNVSVTDISGNNATIVWDEVGSASTWDVLLSDTPVTDFANANPATATSTTYTVNNLEPSTTYYVYVRTKCSSSSFSEWTTATTFTSGCGTILTLPYTESFDNYGTCSNAFPPCWTRHGQPTLGTYSYNGVTCNTPSATDLNAFDGDKSLMVCTQSGCYTYTITPPIQENIRNVAISFYLLKSAAAYVGTLEVGAMSDPSDPVTFETITTIEPANANEWTFFPISFTNANLSGSGNRIAFRHYGMVDNNYYLIDALTIMEAPDCWAALSPSVNEITGNSATLSWTDPNVPAAEWRVKISDVPMSDMNQNANVFDQIVSNTTLTIDYLTGNTTYYYYIQPDCGNETPAAWDNGTFNTLPCNCYVDIYMNDQWANGWEGAKIQMKHGATVFAEATMANGAHDTVRIYTCEDINIDYYFVSGNNDADISFSIVNSFGTTLYTSNGTPAEGCFTSGVPACGISCGSTPGNLTVTDDNGMHSLTWEATPNALTYSVYRSDILIADYLTSTSYTDTEAGPNDTCYTVTAQCIVGESEYSNEACVPSIVDHLTDYADCPYVSIFPNPSYDRFTVSTDFPINRIVVVNLTGQEVIRKEVTGNRTVINVSELPEGIYLVKIYNNKNCFVRKIIVE